MGRKMTPPPPPSASDLTSEEEGEMEKLLLLRGMAKGSFFGGKLDAFVS